MVFKRYKPRFNSETQKRKREEKAEHPAEKVGCCKCGRTNTTLRKVDDKYYCQSCFDKVMAFMERVIKERGCSKD